jgi:transmembrane sensor
MSRIDMDEMFSRYLKGETLPEETEQVEAWLDRYQHPKSEWTQLDATGREQWLNDLFVEIQGDIETGDRKVVRLRPRIMLLRIAAAIAAAFLLFTGAYLFGTKPATLVALNVASNQKTRIVLADSSTIWVNAQSSLKYPKEFKGKTREVYLSGEAYFDITHDASRPFIIHTGNVVTTVLGTAFNIKSDSLGHTVVVTVTRGKVSVASGGHLLGILTPNQQISFNTASQQKTETAVDAAKVIAWQTSYIHFNDITFADAAAALQLRFKVKIAFANDKVKNCRFTGAALKEEKLAEILKVICNFNNATYRTKPDGSIVIDGPGCE